MTKLFQTVDDQLPGAIRFLVYLALAVRGASARTVEQAFGAASNRADAAGQMQNALAASLAPLAPQSLLQRYTEALRSRNALLKQPVLDPVALESFSRELVGSGEEIIRLRRELVPAFSPLARQAYSRISGGAEEFHLQYVPSIKGDFKVELAQSLARERTYRSTVVGPHRDELQLLLEDRPAGQFGSEGQKRSIAVALKMAQILHRLGYVRKGHVVSVTRDDLPEDVLAEINDRHFALGVFRGVARVVSRLSRRRLPRALCRCQGGGAGPSGRQGYCQWLVGTRHLEGCR